jgi:hypothetical protein
MKTKILSGLICCLGIFSANAQTITAPVGQSLTVTNPIDITVAGGSVNVPVDGSYNFGATKVLSIKGTNNLLLGANAGPSNTGNNNLFLGANAGFSNVSGFANTFMGESSGSLNTSGTNNMFLGAASGAGNVVGNSGTFIGVNAGRFSNADGNSFVGAAAGYSTTSGTGNAGFGSGSGYLNTTGSQNVFLGANAGFNVTTGSGNVFIGNGANTSSATVTNSVAIGSNAIVAASNTIVLGSGATTITGAGLGTGSGLRFANLTSLSATTATSGSTKVLSVDGSGNVILVALAGATTTSVNGPVAESTWKNQDGYLYNNSTNGVVINGTGLDGNALIVKGGVLSKEVNVKVEGAESWPDYVFKPSYKRMSLEEVEKFISINGHLPNVASANEMAATGNNLNKTDIKLLEKVEELTLYLLEMKKANDAQSTEIQSLKNQMNKLKKNRK